MGKQVIYSSQPITLKGVTLSSNSATANVSGGGVYAGGDLTLVYSIIRQNHGEFFGGGFWTWGKLVFSHTQVLNNTAGQPGSGAGAGGVSVGPATLTGGLFQNNISLGGTGGLYANSGANVMGTRFINNQANGGGAGALYLPSSGNSQIVNALFVGNDSSQAGSAMQISTSDNVQIINSTISGPNQGNDVAAIDVSKGTTTITNTIIANVPTGIQQTSPATVYQEYNLFFGNTANIGGTVGGGTGSLYNIDPQFVDAANGDFRLRTGSPAIDVGDNSAIAGYPVDLAGNPRIVNTIVDMGAFEYRLSYVFEGFFPPISNTRTNNIKGGSTVPVKWRLMDATTNALVTNTASLTGKTYTVIDCNTSEALFPSQEAQGNNNLKWDQGDKQFVFNWKTPKTPPGQCLRLDMTFTDGMTKSAKLFLKK